MRINLLFLSVIILLGCEEEVPLETDYIPNYFVSANLTDKEAPFNVRILQNQPVNETSALNPVTEATIRLMAETSDGEEQVVASEFTYLDGLYTAKELVLGESGTTYWLEIEWLNGERLQSEKEILVRPIPIIDLNYDEVDKVASIEFEDPEPRNFYRVIDVPAPYEEVTVIGPYGDIDLGLYDDVLFNGNRVFLDFSVLLDLYDVEVSLLHLNFSTFNYLASTQRQLKSQEDIFTEYTGPPEFFSTPPLPIAGNMKREDGRPVFGNFSVYSTSSVILAESP